eukprot:201055-Prymnesium_polylepis.2
MQQVRSAVVPVVVVVALARHHGRCAVQALLAPRTLPLDHLWRRRRLGLRLRVGCQRVLVELLPCDHVSRAAAAPPPARWQRRGSGGAPAAKNPASARSISYVASSSCAELVLPHAQGGVWRVSGRGAESRAGRRASRRVSGRGAESRAGRPHRGG